MPTYEYICDKCGHTFEQVQPMSASALATCRRRLRAEAVGQGEGAPLDQRGAGLIFKGSGFYITDYRSEGYKEAAKKDVAPSTPLLPRRPQAPDSAPAAKPATPKPAAERVSVSSSG